MCTQEGDHCVLEAEGCRPGGGIEEECGFGASMGAAVWWEGSFCTPTLSL
jgi:hypothetical protein